MVEYVKVTCPNCGGPVDVALKASTTSMVVGSGRLQVTVNGEAEHSCGEPVEVTGL